jgi:LPS export ABC transporter protein LptC
MHRRSHAEGVADKPEMWVHADAFTIDDAQSYRFENAQAVIYSRADREEIKIEANQGHFNQEKGAKLDGDVKLEAGTLRMRVSNIEWNHPADGTTGMAFTESPVIIDDPDLQLSAAKLRLYPDSQEFELIEVSGVVRFGKELL